MEKTLGLSSSAIVGRTAEQVYGEEVGERIRAWDFRVLSGETIEEEHTVPVKGENLAFHEVRVPIRNSAGEIIGVCGIGRDVTERRSALLKPAAVQTGYRSKAMKETMELARQAAATDSIVTPTRRERIRKGPSCSDGYTSIRGDQAALSSLSIARLSPRIWLNQSFSAMNQVPSPEPGIGRKDCWNLQRAELCY